MQVPMRGQGNGNIARRLFEAFNDRHIEDGIGLVSEDLLWRDLPLDLTLGGKGGYRQWVEGWLAAFPNARVEMGNIVENEGWVAVEGIARGVQSGMMVLPGREVGPTGRAVELPFSLVMQIVRGRIFRARIYYDAATLLRQLGLPA